MTAFDSENCFHSLSLQKQRQPSQQTPKTSGPSSRLSPPTQPTPVEPRAAQKQAAYNWFLWLNSSCFIRCFHKTSANVCERGLSFGKSIDLTTPFLAFVAKLRWLLFVSCFFHSQKKSWLHRKLSTLRTKKASESHPQE